MAVVVVAVFTFKYSDCRFGGGGDSVNGGGEL